MCQLEGQRLAVAVNVSSVSSSTVLSPIVASTGGLFAPSVTVTVIVSLSDAVPSVTSTSNINETGPVDTVCVNVWPPDA